MDTNNLFDFFMLISMHQLSRQPQLFPIGLVVFQAKLTTPTLTNTQIHTDFNIH